MRITTCILFLLLSVPLLRAQHHIVDFESYQSGQQPSADYWKMKWLSDDESQRNLWRVFSGVGRNGTKGLSLDVNQAKREYNSVFAQGVQADSGPGNIITITADFRFTSSGATPSEFHASIAGIRIADSDEWWRPGHYFCIARRGNNAVGAWDPANRALDEGRSITGWITNPQIGGKATKADVPMQWESDWITLTVTLMDNGSSYQSTLYISCNGKVLYQSKRPFDTKLPSGAVIYAGVTNGYNNAPVETVMAEAVGVSKVVADNFSLKGGEVTYR